MALGLGAVAAGLAYRHWTQAQAIEAASRSKAVVAVFTLSIAGSDDYFSATLADEISTGLAGVHGLSVLVAPPLPAHHDLTLPSEGKRLGANAVLEGSARLADGRARVELRLLRSSTGEPLWSQTYDRDAMALPALHRDIATGLAAVMRKRFGGNVGALASERPVDPRAYDLYLRGRHAADQGGAAGAGRAVDYFAQAVARDSSFAPAWAGLAAAQLRRFAAGASYEETAPHARAAAERALRLDPGLAAGHAAAGALLAIDWHWAEAASELQRTLELNSADLESRQILARVFVALRRNDDALSQAQRAHIIAPLDEPIGMHLCAVYDAMRRDEEALDVCQRSMSARSPAAGSHGILARVFLRLTRFPEARHEMEREMSLTGPTPRNVAQLALIDAYQGHAARARDAALGVERSGGSHLLPFTSLAMVHAKLGDREHAIALLRSMISAHGGDALDLVAAPEFDALASDARYRAIVREAGLARD